MSTSRFKRLIIEIHRRSLWQVLAVYLLGAAAAYQVVQSLTEGLGLPEWFPGFAIVLFIALLPVVLATAVVREQALPKGGPPQAHGPEAEAGAEPPATTPPTEGPPGRHVLAWRRLAFSVVGVFALWGFVAAGWLALGGRLPGPTAGTERSSAGIKLVVLPFENLGQPEDEYFADGVTEEITSRLSEIPELGVISRTTAIQFKGSTRTVREIAAQLDVDYVLEGTVRWERALGAPSQVRVTPQLIRVSDDTNIWTERYDAVLSEIFQVQSDIAENVALALDITLLGPQRQAIWARPTENLDAYDYFLRGNDHYARRFIEEEAWSAVEMYEAAIGLDPEFAHAYAALSRALVWLNQQFERGAALPRAREAVDEALRLAPDLAEAHMALGDFYYYGLLDLEQALEQYEWVQRRQPSNSDAVALIAWIQRRMGDWDPSIANAELALELDPLNTVWLIGQAQNYFYTRQYEYAEPYFLRAIANAPDVPYYYRWAAWFYLAWDGTADRAHLLLEQAVLSIDPGQLLLGGESSWIILHLFADEYGPALERLSPDSAEVDAGYYYLARGYLSARRGDEDEARAFYDSARVVFEARVQEGPEALAPHNALGLAYAGLGRTEDAIREGELAVRLVPVSRDAMTGTNRVRDLALIYMTVGDYEAAIDQLELLLSIPSEMSANLLRVDPFWDPLRSDARFQALLEMYDRADPGGRIPRRITA
ncbi:MAG: tetratricopeptide repeat protein [Gemmatimonadota bacterium]|nr:MAG: tetratricopeptide repeat protein [Gemmatimonadota bacterium]